MDTEEKYSTGEYYHVFNKNLDTLKVFRERKDCDRFIELIKFYQFKETPCAYSEMAQYIRAWGLSAREFTSDLDKDSNKLVDIVAYCLMPNHYHFLLYQIEDHGISKFLSNVLNGFTRYYNLKNERKGPLWVGRAKNVHIKNDEHLWEESRYIHRNPLKAGLVRKPNEWIYSSYREYLNLIPPGESFCAKSLLLESLQDNYQSFVEDGAADDR